jgi:hypothetical protein
MARNENQITDTQFEVIANRYGFYNDDEWEFAVADNSVFVADHYRGEQIRY